MTPEQYATLDDSQLRELLQLPPGKEGLRYYFSKADKLTWITSELGNEEREQLLLSARLKQQEHHRYLRGRRQAGSPKRQVLIEQKMSTQMWRFVAEERVPASFKDEVTGRKASIAYTLEGVTSGDRIRVTKSTLVDAHERLGLVTGWPPPKGRVVAPEAALAGLTTGASLRSNLGHLRARD